MSAYEQFIERVKDIYRIGGIQGHLGWDQETIMPAKGAEVRGEILAWLAKERHIRLTDEKMGELLTVLEADEHKCISPLCNSSSFCQKNNLFKCLTTKFFVNCHENIE